MSRIQRGAAPLPVAADDQVQPSGGEHWDDDVERSAKAPSDFALIKPSGECFVTGRAWATPGTTTTSLLCRFRVGAIETRFAVFGDRSWTRGLIDSISDPEPFESLDLSMERAYGGPRLRRQPLRPRPRGGSGRPNSVSRTSRTPRTSSARPRIPPDPVVVGPLSMMWPARQAYAGTYGDDYQRDRWPWFPEDFDWRFFLEAPEDMRLREGFFQGDERVEADYLSPEDPKVRTMLPGVAPRVFVDQREPGQAPSDQAHLCGSGRPVPRRADEARHGHLERRHRSDRAHVARYHRGALRAARRDRAHLHEHGSDRRPPDARRAPSSSPRRCCVPKKKKKRPPRERTRLKKPGAERRDAVAHRC